MLQKPERQGKMTSIDNLAEEIMQGLQEYADLADTAMKKAVRKSATQVKNEISATLGMAFLQQMCQLITILTVDSHFKRMAMPSVAVVGYPANRTLHLRKKTVCSCWSI